MLIPDSWDGVAEAEAKISTDPESRFTAKAQRCHKHIQAQNRKRGTAYNPYAVCTASLGYEQTYRAKSRSR